MYMLQLGSLLGRLNAVALILLSVLLLGRAILETWYGKHIILFLS